jgi:hypothetical protein
MSATAMVAFAATLGAGDTLWQRAMLNVVGRRPKNGAFDVTPKDDHFPMTTYRLFEQERKTS